MNKQTLVSQIAKRLDMPKAEVGRVVDEALVSIRDSVVRGQRVTLQGFGTFERQRRAARTGRNPHTGEPVPIPPTTVPSFRPGLAFKEEMVARRRKPAARRKTARRR